MHLKTLKSELPSAYKVGIHIHNKILSWLKELKEDILISFLTLAYPFWLVDSPSIKATPGKVSIMSDGWSADTTKQAFLGMTEHWIDMKDKGGKEKWTLCGGVLACRALSGDHSGENVGRYLMGLYDCMGITSKTHFKVHT